MNPARLKKAWDEFFFKPTDPAPIGIFRIFFGLIIMANGILLGPDLFTWFSEKGVLSLETALKLTGIHRINLIALLPSGDSWIVAFYVFHMLSALFFTVGLFTRVSAAAVFITLVSFHHRNTLILNSGDTLMRVVSFLLIFSQAGSAFSLDRVWRVMKGQQSLKAPAVAPWAQRMIQIQLSIVYFFTFLWKMQGSTWADGTAVYYTSRLEEFQRFPIPFLFENLLLMKILTWSTLAIECSMGTLVWIPQIRPYILVLAILLHLSLEYSMNIPLFQWIILSIFILFLKPETLRHTLGYFRQTIQKVCREPIPVFYDGACIFCIRISKVLSSLDIFSRLRLLDFRKLNPNEFPTFDLKRAETQMALYTRSGTWLYGYDTFRYIAWRVPLFWIFAWMLYLPGLAFVGKKIYAWVARHRFMFMGRDCSERDSPCQIISDPYQLRRT